MVNGQWSVVNRLWSTRQRGQVAVLAVLLVMLFFLLACVLVDGYELVEARNWGYQVVQQAALAGVSQGRDWSSLATPPCSGGPAPIQLDAEPAMAASENILRQEMALRDISGYSFSIHVLPGYSGGTVAGFPPIPVRLGAGRGSWSASEPSVGVYLSFPVSTFLMSFVGRPTVWVEVFASASVHQPEGACVP